jgi:hypothetical protein
LGAWKANYTGNVDLELGIKTLMEMYILCSFIMPYHERLSRRFVHIVLFPSQDVFISLPISRTSLQHPSCPFTSYSDGLCLWVPEIDFQNPVHPRSSRILLTLPLMTCFVHGVLPESVISTHPHHLFRPSSTFDKVPRRWFDSILVLFLIYSPTADSSPHVDSSSSPPACHS